MGPSLQVKCAGVGAQSRASVRRGWGTGRVGLSSGEGRTRRVCTHWPCEEQAMLTPGSEALCHSERYAAGNGRPVAWVPRAEGPPWAHSFVTAQGKSMDPEDVNFGPAL